MKDGDDLWKIYAGMVEFELVHQWGSITNAKIIDVKRDPVLVTMIQET